jgi:hypothetical protein
MGFLHKAIEGEVVVETEQCKSRNHMRHWTDPRDAKQDMHAVSGTHG